MHKFCLDTRRRLSRDININSGGIANANLIDNRNESKAETKSKKKYKRRNYKGKGTYFDLEFGIGDIGALRTNLVIRICWFCDGSPHFFQFPQKIKMKTFPGKSNGKRETDKEKRFFF